MLYFDDLPTSSNLYIESTVEPSISKNQKENLTT